MEHIETIMIGVFIFLILAHFSLHFYFKYLRRKKDAARAAKKAAEQANSESTETPSSK